MFDFGELEQQEVWELVDGTFKLKHAEVKELARGRLARKSAGTGAAQEDSAKLKIAVRMASEDKDRAKLKIAVRMASEDKEPSEFILNRWSRSQANDLIRHFVIEEEIGVGETIKLCEVQRLLGAVDWSPAGLTTFFGAGEVDVKDVLRVFAGVDMLDKETMRFRAVYRLLEVLGFSLHAFLNRLVNGPVDEEASGPTLRFGNYRVLKGIGSGFNGMCIYAGEHVVTHQRVAVKWPVGREELAVLRDIQRQSPPAFLGLPQVFAHGSYDGIPYVVTELLGSPLTKIFERISGRPTKQRWRVVSVIGRMVLRRLEAVHRCGYVHCDVSPENILFGPPRTSTDRWEVLQAAQDVKSPYLIDFGLAQKHPGGSPLENEHGSSEWSSVRSALGGLRLPEDDLEALGWILVNGLFGNLPWFDLLSKAYGSWDSPALRARAIRKVQEAKLRLLNDGFDCMGGEWSVLAQIPPSLERYLQLCRSDQATGLGPDYECLAELLGGCEGMTLREAEMNDLRHFKDVTVLYF